MATDREPEKAGKMALVMDQDWGQEPSQQATLCGLRLTTCNLPGAEGAYLPSSADGIQTRRDHPGRSTGSEGKRVNRTDKEQWFAGIVSSRDGVV